MSSSRQRLQQTPSTPTVADREVFVVGGGLVRAGAADALRELVARNGGIGVLNTFTAKGLFPWDSAAHLGTIGLQERDVELAGLAGRGVVEIGVDDGELPSGAVRSCAASWREIPAHELIGADAAELGLADADQLGHPPPRPPLYTRLSAALQPFYAAPGAPLNPARAAADLAGWLPYGASVAADAGRAGFFVGRTFPTRELASVQLPVHHVPGFAATRALTATRTGRTAVAVVDGIDEATQAALDRARRAADGAAGSGCLVVEVWSSAGPRLGAAERLELLDEAVGRGGVHVLELGVDFGPTLDALVAVAGRPRWHTLWG